MAVDVRLYAIADPEHTGGRDLADLGAQFASGGATLVQLRDKKGETREMIERARALMHALAPLHVPLLINDRVDVALAVKAAGVHIGQDDMPAADARRLLGPRAIIGLSVKTLEQGAIAPLEHLDYVAIGGVFATTSKDNTSAPIGLGGLCAVARAIRTRASNFPICAIAGINESNAASVIESGADGVSVISALSLASDPHAATQRLRAIVDGALAKRGRA
ncbi:MAG TPA: thiamine phosphate synthase [Pseudolabrys sp.]|nr:thiamine phosphate synthase [Pseudolabrys sp.]